jgi:hypothetical protein
MLLLLLALADGPAVTEKPAVANGQATLQSCEMSGGGWVCHYKMPPITLIGTPDTTPPTGVAPPTTAAVAQPSAVDVPEAQDGTDARTAAESAEAARKARLVARCADAGWLSLCLPGDRLEARRLKAEFEASAALRGKVTALLSEKRCDEAVATALTGGDLALARDARDFCRR